MKTRAKRGRIASLVALSALLLSVLAPMTAFAANHDGALMRVDFDGHGLDADGGVEESKCGSKADFGLDSDSTADPDAYLKFVLTVGGNSGATEATLVGPWGSYEMEGNNGVFMGAVPYHVLTSPYAGVYAEHDGDPKGNVILTVSNGCVGPSTADVTVSVAKIWEGDEIESTQATSTATFEYRVKDSGTVVATGVLSTTGNGSDSVTETLVGYDDSDEFSVSLHETGYTLPSGIDAERCDVTSQSLSPTDAVTVKAGATAAFTATNTVFCESSVTPDTATAMVTVDKSWLDQTESPVAPTASTSATFVVELLNSESDQGTQSEPVATATLETTGEDQSDSVTFDVDPDGTYEVIIYETGAVAPEGCTIVSTESGTSVASGGVTLGQETRFSVTNEILCPPSITVEKDWRGAEGSVEFEVTFYGYQDESESSDVVATATVSSGGSVAIPARVSDVEITETVSNLPNGCASDLVQVFDDRSQDSANGSSGSMFENDVLVGYSKYVNQGLDSFTVTFVNVVDCQDGNGDDGNGDDGNGGNGDGGNGTTTPTSPEPEPIPEYFVAFDKLWAGTDADLDELDENVNDEISFRFDGEILAIGQELEVELDMLYIDISEDMPEAPANCTITSDLDDTFTTPAEAQDGEVFVITVTNTIVCTEVAGVVDDADEDDEVEPTPVSQPAPETSPTAVEAVSETRKHPETGASTTLLTLLGLLSVGLGVGMLSTRRRQTE